MTWFALGISILSLALTLFFRSKSEAVTRALKASREREAGLVQTLTEVLDGDGTVRGQLMLPGKMSTDDAVVELRKAEMGLSFITAQADDLRREIERERKNDEDIKTLVEAVNGGSVVKIRLPGEVVIPNATPCGGGCKYGLLYNGTYYCRTGIDPDGDKNSCMNVRPQFLDANNQCVMFERKK